MARWVLLWLMVVAVSGGGWSQEKAAPKAAKSRAAAEVGKASGAQMSAEQVEALRGDLKKMRALLEQMENNLGFVGSGPSPLKHQFELEIEMWRTLLEHMEKQVKNPG